MFKDNFKKVRVNLVDPRTGSITFYVCTSVTSIVPNLNSILINCSDPSKSLQVENYPTTDKKVELIITL